MRTARFILQPCAFSLPRQTVPDTVFPRKIEQRADREWSFGRAARFRLLARRGMLEFYLDDHFMECYTMGCPDGREARIGVGGGAEDGPVSDLKVWRMQ